MEARRTIAVRLEHRVYTRRPQLGGVQCCADLVGVVREVVDDLDLTSGAGVLEAARDPTELGKWRDHRGEVDARGLEMRKFDIPDVGGIAWITDPAGNTVEIQQDPDLG